MLAIYMRVSSESQSTRSQEPELRRWVEAQGEPARWFVDHFTGKTNRRPGMTELLAAVHRGDVSKVVVWRVDRLARNTAGTLELFRELGACGVGFVSLREGFDLSTPAGMMLATILSSVSQYEVELKAERQLAGIAACRDQRTGKCVSQRPGTRGFPNWPPLGRPPAWHAHQINQLEAAGNPYAARPRHDHFGDCPSDRFEPKHRLRGPEGACCMLACLFAADQVATPLTWDQMSVLAAILVAVLMGGSAAGSLMVWLVNLVVKNRIGELKAYLLDNCVLRVHCDSYMCELRTRMSAIEARHYHPPAGDVPDRLARPPC